MGVVLFGRLFARDASRVFAMLAPLVIGLSAAFVAQRRAAHAVEWLMLLLLVHASIEMEWTKSVAYTLVMSVGTVAAVLHLFRADPSAEDSALQRELSRR